jgi:hypothetical protein
VEPLGYADPEAAAPGGEPAYVSGLEESPAASSGALTKPRDRYGPEAGPKRGWRRQREAAGSPSAAYLRWPHPQG